MASILLNAVGTAVGGPVGGFIGSALGSVIDNMLFSNTQKLPDLVGPRMADLSVQVSTYGKVIPETFGTIRLAGNVIWSRPIKETEIRETSTVSGGKGGGGGSQTQTTVSYKYSITLAIAICAGKVDEIVRVWADSKVLDATVLNSAAGLYNVYLGSEDQMPDPIIESFEGAGNAPAYRGMAYVVIQDFPLEDYGNRIPNFTFEVRRTVRFQPAVEDKIKSIIMIPGAGEYVYSTDIAEKALGLEDAWGNFVQQGATTKLNMHNFDGKANVLAALDQLEKTFPNLEWIGLVVTWFATSLDAGACEIIPKVEFDSQGARVSPYEWQVGSLNRDTAQVVLQFGDGTKTYGGTPSDKSIIDLCQEIRNRGYNILFYPMPFVDTITPQMKPWRGRIAPANATDCNSWFTKTNGYNAFVRHYSRLQVGGVYLKNLVQAFVIGSELVGITGFSSGTGVYPAVTQLKSLAALVKADVGAGVKVTYAADWSEYHSKGGWYNLDPLWSDTNIDFVGIDAYFPLTPDLPQSQITETKIKEYWEKGEGWDYFYADSVNRTGLTSYGGNPAYAWKNLEHWWNSTHVNPNSASTAWTAKMKPVWFTEYGFPSVDGCANQPNVFYDPRSVESFYPRGSRGRVDFQAQREALNATEDYLESRSLESGNANLVPRRFVWAGDARPFPFWPDLLAVWSDGTLWKTGHWVQGKLGASSLGAIVEVLLKKVGLVSSQYDVTRLTDLVEGFIVTKQSTVRQLLEQLQQAYFFDAVESDGQLKFIKRGGEAVVTINQDRMVPIAGSGTIREVCHITRAQELELPRQINVVYLNRLSGYQPSTQISQRQTVSAVDIVTINLPIVLSDQQAKVIADISLYNAWMGRTSYRFMLPTQYAALEPTDIVTPILNNVNHTVRIMHSQIARNGLLELRGKAEDVSTYDFYAAPGEPPPVTTEGNIIPQTRLELLDLPAFPSDTETQGLMRVAMTGIGSNWQGGVLYRSDDGGEAGGNNFSLITSASSPAITGSILNQVTAGPSEFFDDTTQIEVLLLTGTLQSVTELAVLNGANAALIGDEIIQFQNATLLSTGRYKLSRLLRGRLGTEHTVGNHPASTERFVLLDGSVIKQGMPNNLLNLARHYKCVSVGGTLTSTPEQAFTWQGKVFKPYSPVHIAGSRDGSGNISLSWKRRTRISGDWRDGVDVPLGEESERYEVEIMSGSTLKRTITGLAAPAATYTAAEQVTDFGSAQASVSVKTYQLSAIVGRGYPGIATV